MKSRIWIVTILVALLAFGCGTASLHQPESRNDQYGIDSLKRVADTNSKAALLRISEGERDGTLNEPEAAYLRARITYLYDNDYPLAMKCCQQALDAFGENEVWQRVETLYLLATICYSEKDLTTCLNACSEGKAIAHHHKLAFHEYSFDYLVGKCQFNLNREEDGLNLMRQSLKEARTLVRTRSDYEHFAYFGNDFINCYFIIDDLKTVLRLSEMYAAFIEEMESRYPEETLCCNRCRYYLYVGRAEAKEALGLHDEAEADFRRALEFDYAYSYEGYRHQIDYYAAIGNVDSVLSLTTRFPYRDADTVRRNYRMRLSRIEQAYRVAGDTLNANRFQQRIDALSQLIEHRVHQEGTAVNAAQYETQHFRLALDDMMSSIKRMRKVLVAMVLVILAVLSVWFVDDRMKTKRMTAEIGEKAKSMEVEMGQLQRQVRILARNDVAMPEGSKRVNQSLAAFIEGQKLYLNRDISRASVAKLMGCSHKTMTKMLDEIQPGLSFPDYIKNLRIAHALNLMKKTPNLTVQQFAEQSGFYSISSFERSFKAATGKTPRAFMKELSQS